MREGVVVTRDSCAEAEAVAGTREDALHLRTLGVSEAREGEREGEREGGRERERGGEEEERGMRSAKMQRNKEKRREEKRRETVGGWSGVAVLASRVGLKGTHAREGEGICVRQPAMVSCAAAAVAV